MWFGINLRNNPACIRKEKKRNMYSNLQTNGKKPACLHHDYKRKCARMCQKYLKALAIGSRLYLDFISEAFEQVHLFLSLATRRTLLDI